MSKTGRDRIRKESTTKDTKDTKDMKDTKDTKEGTWERRRPAGIFTRNGLPVRRVKPDEESGTGTGTGTRTDEEELKETKTWISNWPNPLP